MIVSSFKHYQEETSSIGLIGEFISALAAPSWLNQYQEHQMGSCHKDPMEDHHYIDAHDKWHTNYKIRNIEVVHTLGFSPVRYFLGFVCSILLKLWIALS